MSRPARGRLLGGVAAGLAEHLRVPVLPVRLALLVMMALGGGGFVLYAALWVLVPAEGPQRRWRGDRDVAQLLVFLVLAAVAQALLWRWGGAGRLVLSWCFAAVGVGAALLWQRAGAEQRQRWSAMTPGAPWLGMALGNDRRTTVVRVALGGLLVVVGLGGLLAFSGSLGAVRDGLLFGAAFLAGGAIVVAPWLWRMVEALRRERLERIRSQERAEIAAMVHDKVLHTLALIQRKADDPRAIVRLARGQERELRNWLYRPQFSPDERVAAAMESAAAEVEDAYAVTVDVVVVGDAAMDSSSQALVRATREALVNAGRHAGVASVSLYVEVEPERVSVFVRDRGGGFDVDGVAEDRHGVRDSIVGRMRRHGGEAEIRSVPGAGTEVRLTMPRLAVAGGGDG